MTREAHTLALSPELGTPLQQAGCPSPQPARRPPACPSRAGQPSCQLLAGPIVQQCQEMAAAAQAGKGRARKGGGVGRAGRRLPTQTPLPGWACLPREAGHRHTRLFPTCPLRTGFRVGVHATVRRVGGPARPPPGKDLWSLVSQLSAWKQCQVAECF